MAASELFEQPLNCPGCKATGMARIWEEDDMFRPTFAKHLGEIDGPFDETNGKTETKYPAEYFSFRCTGCGTVLWADQK